MGCLMKYLTGRSIFLVVFEFARSRASLLFRLSFVMDFHAVSSTLTICSSPFLHPQILAKHNKSIREEYVLTIDLIAAVQSGNVCLGGQKRVTLSGI